MHRKQGWSWHQMTNIQFLEMWFYLAKCQHESKPMGKSQWRACSCNSCAPNFHTPRHFGLLGFTLVFCLLWGRLKWSLQTVSDRLWCPFHQLGWSKLSFFLKVVHGIFLFAKERLITISQRKVEDNNSVLKYFAKLEYSKNLLVGFN